MSNTPYFDKDGALLTRSGVSEHIWTLYHTNSTRFKKEVTDYFARAYPGWKVVRAIYDKRIILIRDERKKSLV